MKKQTIEEGNRCPRCGQIENQFKKGRNRSGTQRCKCQDCSVAYTIESKKRAYPEETRQLALEMFTSGVSGRGAGKVLGMDRSIIYT